MGLLGKASVVDKGETASPCEDVLIRYQAENPSFSCIVIDSPVDLQALSYMTRLFGTASALPEGRGMVLLPAALDRDRIAHRLSASLKAKTLAAVSADTPEKALAEIRLYR
jgi:hypothetical protein